jgi:hypothetical protein
MELKDIKLNFDKARQVLKHINETGQLDLIQEMPVLKKTVRNRAENYLNIRSLKSLNETLQELNRLSDYFKPMNLKCGDVLECKKQHVSIGKIIVLKVENIKIFDRFFYYVQFARIYDNMNFNYAISYLHFFKHTELDLTRCFNILEHDVFKKIEKYDNNKRIKHDAYNNLSRFEKFKVGHIKLLKSYLKEKLKKDEQEKINVHLNNRFNNLIKAQIKYLKEDNINKFFSTKRLCDIVQKTNSDGSIKIHNIAIKYENCFYYMSQNVKHIKEMFNEYQLKIVNDKLLSIDLDEVNS